MPIPKLGRVIPFGYRQDPDNRGILLPIPEELELLVQAKKHLKKYSARSVAAWLTENSGRYISHVGLLHRVKVERRRKHKAIAYETIAKTYKQAYETAEKLKNQRLGARATEAPAD